MTGACLPVPLRGIVPPVITPLTDSLTLDTDAFKRLIAHLVEGGVHGLFLLGSTGEGPNLHGALRRQIIDWGCEFAAGWLPVLAGVSDTCLQESVALAEHARWRARWGW